MDAVTYATGARRLLAAILLQALRDAKKPDFLGTEARQWIIDAATEITTALWGFGVDGMYLLTLLDAGLLDHIIHQKPPRYARAVHRTNRPEFQSHPLPDFLSEGLLKC